MFDASYPDSKLRRGRVQEDGNVTPALTCGSENNILRYEGKEPAILSPLRTEEGRRLRKQGIDKFSNKALYPRQDGMSNTITSVQKDNYLQEAAKELKQIAQNGRSCDVDVTINNDGSLRPYNATTKAKDGISEFVTQHEDNSANTITTNHGGNVYGNMTRYRIRKLTERECFRLMDLEDSDIDKIQSAGISKTAQYKLAGNSIVVNCLYHIFRKMFVEPQCEEQQLSLF